MKKIIIMFLLASSFLLTSCIKLDAEVVVDEDFNSTGTMVVDYSTIQAMSQSADPSAEPKTPCEIYESWEEDNEWEEKEYTVLSCTNIDENVASIEVDYGNVWGDIKERNGVYIMEMTQEWTWVDAWEEWQSKEEVAKSMAMMKWMWLEINFKYSFPGKVVDSNIWETDGKSVSFTIYDLVEAVDTKSYIIYTNKTNYEADAKDLKEDFLKQKFKLKTKAQYKKQLILAKKELNKTYKWRKYVAKFEKIIPRVKKQKLEELMERIGKIDTSNKAFAKYKDLFSYLEALIVLELLNRK